MKILKKEPGGVYHAKDIPNTLEAMQAEVGGYIETVRVDSTCCIICDEEGRLKNLPFNTHIGVDLYGTILIVGTKNDEFTDVPELILFLTGVKA